MTDMELAYRKAQIDKACVKTMKGFFCNSAYDRYNHAYALESALINDLCSTPGMTYEHACKLVSQR